MARTAIELQLNATLVSAFQAAVEHCNFDSVVDNLRRIKERQSWEARYLGSRIMKSETFRDFITAKKPHGCGWELERVRKLLDAKLREASDEDRPMLMELCDWYRQMVTDARGGDRKSEEARQVLVDIKNDNIIIDPPTQGTSKSYLSGRLSRERPDLYERTKLPKGNPRRLSAHAAAVEAGWRAVLIQVPRDDADALALALKKHCNAKVLRQLLRLLKS